MSRGQLAARPWRGCPRRRRHGRKAVAFAPSLTASSLAVALKLVGAQAPPGLRAWAATGKVRRRRPAGAGGCATTAWVATASGWLSPPPRCHSLPFPPFSLLRSQLRSSRAPPPPAVIRRPHPLPLQFALREAPPPPPPSPPFSLPVLVVSWSESPLPRLVTIEVCRSSEP